MSKGCARLGHFVLLSACVVLRYGDYRNLYLSSSAPAVVDPLPQRSEHIA